MLEKTTANVFEEQFHINSELRQRIAHLESELGTGVVPTAVERAPERTMAGITSARAGSAY